MTIRYLPVLCGALNATALSIQVRGAFFALCAAGGDVAENMCGDQAVRSDMETVSNGKRAAMRPTQYRLLPPPAVSYQPRMKHAGSGERAKFIELSVKSLVNSPQSTGMKFWSINPYVGCELGCTYCYAHYAHRYVVERAQDMGQVPHEKITQFFQPNHDTAFSQHIFVKQRSAVLQALERDLVRIHKRSSPDNPATVAIGTATDPYQPAERIFGITRAILERLVTTEGLQLGITTKSPLVCRDIDVLLELGRKHKVTVYVSLICKTTRLIRCFEQHSPSPQARFRALSRLRDAGITAGINAAPVLPGITDSVFEIEALMAAAKDAGANFVHPSVLRIYPSVRDEFLPVIERHFPNLVPRYRAAYAHRRSAPSNYLDAIERRFERFARRYGIHSANPFKREERRQVEPEAQLSLL